MRRRTVPLVAFAAVLLMLVTACAGGDAAVPTPTATATSEPAGSPTPEATSSPTVPPGGTPTATPLEDVFGVPEVTARGNSHIVMGEGTYCWTSTPGAPGLCADKIGIVVPGHILTVDEGGAIELEGDLDWRGASTLTLQLFRRPDQPVSSGPGGNAYRPEGTATTVPFEHTSDGIRFVLPVAPGDWLLTLSIFEERGDASYGLLVHQRPSVSGAFRTRLGVATEIEFGVEYRLEGTPYTLTFASIEEDSRCPVDVTCVWAGQTRVTLVARTLTDPTPLGLTVPNGGEVTGVIDTTYQVRIVDVRPEPRSTVQLAPEDYRIVVVAERADAASTGGGVRGVAHVGPACPVQRQGQWCPDHPLAAELVILDAGGDEVEHVESGDDGWYEVELSPGVYELDARTPPGSPFPIGQRIEFSVTAGTWTDLDVAYDSGIR